jgi:drug/metabolite transporter (DMT)-like permease
MGLSFLLWSTATKLTLSTSRIANMIFLSPLLSLVLINTFLGEKILVSTLAGLGMIMCGLVLQRVFSARSAGAVDTGNKT